MTLVRTNGTVIPLSIFKLVVVINLCDFVDDLLGSKEGSILKYRTLAKQPQKMIIFYKNLSNNYRTHPPGS
jgi:hypothetical protein